MMIFLTNLSRVADKVIKYKNIRYRGTVNVFQEEIGLDRISISEKHV